MTKVKERTEDVAAVVERPHAVDPFSWMGDLFEQRPFLLGRRLPELFEQSFGSVETIRVEEINNEDETIIRAEIPGVDPEKDIEISVAGGRLTISATREQRETSTEHGYRSEFHYGSFRRTMAMPRGVEAADVTATYDDGILEIHVPTHGEAEATTKVEVKRGGDS